MYYYSLDDIIYSNVKNFSRAFYDKAIDILDYSSEATAVFKQGLKKSKDWCEGMG